MKENLVVILLLLCCCRLSAQNSPSAKWKFISLNQVGLLQGESHTAASLQSVNGFRRGHVFAGLGTGLDYYRFRSVPLFAEGRVYPGVSKSQYYFYGDAGTNFVWQERQTFNGIKEVFRPGFFGAAGIGYQAGLGNGMAITLSAGYSYKKVINSQQQISACPFSGPCIVSPETYRYSLNRIIFQLGWLF